MCCSQLAFCKKPFHSQSWAIGQLDCQAFLPLLGRKNQRELPLLMHEAFLNKGACVCCNDVALDPECGHCLVCEAGEPAARPRACAGIQIAAEPWGSAHHVAGPGSGSPTFGCQQLAGLFAAWPASCVLI